MKLAFSKPTAARDEQRVLFENYRSVGYDGLQLKAGQYDAYLTDPHRFVDDWGDLPGAAAGLIVGAGLDEDGVAAIRKVFRFAGEMGTDRIVFCHCLPRGGVSSDDIRGFAGTLSELGREVEQFGAKLTLHHHFNQPVMHRADLEVFFGAASDGSVGLTVDTAHLVKSGVDDVAAVIRDFAHVIDNFHLTDFADGQWRVLGEGDIDFKPIFRSSKEIGYDEWVSTDEESGSEVLEAMETCMAFMKEGLS